MCSISVRFGGFRWNDEINKEDEVSWPIENLGSNVLQISVKTHGRQHRRFWERQGAPRRWGPPPASR